MAIIPDIERGNQVAGQITTSGGVEAEAPRSYRELAESITDVFFAFDRELRYIYWNKACEDLIGISAEEAIGQSIYTVFPGDPEGRDRAVSIYKHVLRTGRPQFYVNKIKLYGRTYFFEISAYPVRDGLTVIAKDVTALSEALAELLERSEELDAFSHSVSHDLSNSMVFIDDFARTALQAMVDGNTNRASDNLRHIIRAVEETRKYVEQLLYYAQAGFKEERGASADSSEVLRALLIELGENLKKAEAELSVAPDLPVVRADAVKVSQIFRNLLVNALGHAKSRPLKVEIGADVEGNTAIFFVRDNGVGIVPDKQKTVFVPFKRLEEAGTPGMGMGLAITKRAVESWGGRIWLESSPGEGCCFYFTAPL